MATSEGSYYVPEQSKLPLLASVGLFLTVFGMSTWLSGTPGSPLIYAAAVLIFASALLDWSRRVTIFVGIVAVIVISALSSKFVGIVTGPLIFASGGLMFATLLWNWFGTAIRENIAGMNSPQLKRSCVWGMSWFIFSEVMFF